MQPGVLVSTIELKVRVEERHLLSMFSSSGVAM